MEHRPLFHVKHLRGMECGQKTVMAAVIVSGARGTCDVPHTLKQLAVPGSRWRVRRFTSSPGRDAIAGWGLTSAAGGAAAWRRPVSQRRTRRPSVAKQATPGPVGGGCDSGCGDPTSWFSKKSYSCSAQVAPSSCGAVGARRAVRHRGVDRRGDDTVFPNEFADQADIPSLLVPPPVVDTPRNSWPESLVV